MSLMMMSTETQSQHSKQMEEAQSQQEVTNVAKWEKVATKLPKALAAAYRALFLSLLEPDDPFFLVMRKMMITCSFMWSPFPIGIALYWIIGPGQQNEEGLSTGLKVAIGGAFALAFVSFIPSWLLVQYSRKASVWVVDYWILSMFFCFFCISLGVPNFPTSTGCFAIIECSIIAHTPIRHHLSHALVCLVMWCISAYNLNIVHTDWPLLTVPDPYYGPPGEILVLTFMGYAIVFFMMMALYIQSLEFHSQVESAISAEKMIKEVATHIQVYDTEAVETTVEKYKEVGITDIVLLSGVESINCNLKLFRPHIPNWLIEQTVTMAKENQNLQANLSAFSMLTPCDSEGDLEDLEQSNDLGVSKQSRRCSSTMKGNSGGSFSRPDSRSSLIVSGSLNAGGAAEVFSGFVTVVVLDYSCELEARQQLITELVDLVHAKATATHGAVLSSIGNTVWVAWNATHRVAQGEVKACNFVHGVHSICSSYIKLTGAVTTCRCRSQLAGTKSKAVTLEISQLSELNNMRLFAQRYNTFVTDAKTETTANFQFILRGVTTTHHIQILPCANAAIAPASPEKDNSHQLIPNMKERILSTLPQHVAEEEDHHADGESIFAGKDEDVVPRDIDDPAAAAEVQEAQSRLRSRKAVFELVGPKSTGADDEWMYTLKNGAGEGEPNAAVTTALNAAIHHDFGEAVSILDKVSDKNVREAKTVVALRETCESHLNSNYSGEF